MGYAGKIQICIEFKMEESAENFWGKGGENASLVQAQG